MATYEYHCSECDLDFEVKRSMKEDVSTYECKKCSSKCNQVIKSPRSFNSYFEGSVKSEQEGL